MAIQQAAQEIKISGYTDFNTGLSAALELLSHSSATEKHLFFIGDIVEGGYKLPNGDYTHVSGQLQELTQQLETQGIKVHLLFLRTPWENQEFMPLWDNLVAQTGGEITNINDPAKLPGLVEELYFKLFTYNKSVTTAMNMADGPQNISIHLPALTMDRAWIYI